MPDVERDEGPARKLVGVFPASAVSERRELLGTLEEVLPVRFQGRESGEVEGLDGILMVGWSRSGGPLELDAIQDERAQNCPSLTVHRRNEGLAPFPQAVELAVDEQLARLLRGRRLCEECLPASETPVLPEGELVLATAGGQPVWWRRPGPGWTHHSAYGLEDLGQGEALRDRLRAGHFMGLLPLLHLLRHVCRELEWRETPLRAAFVIDDPNLHGGSYGYLNYRELIAHAERHGYHVGLATVPLDGWMYAKRAASQVRGNPKFLSLLMHGNSHLSGELGRLDNDHAAQTALAQALRRISALERRSGVAIDRVMAPPHELCSTVALKAMFRLGYEAACIGRRHPWRDSTSLARLTDARLLKWHPTDLMDGGLPIVPRHPIERSREDLVFAALLRQPLILFAHHWDFASGLDLLEQAAQDINDLGDVRWEPVGSIARTCFFTRMVGQALHVQMHARRVVVEVPEGTDFVQVSTSSLLRDEPQRQLRYGSAQVTLAREWEGWNSGMLPVQSGGSLELKLTAPDSLDPVAVPRPKRSPWPIVRRLLVEGRDRARPVLQR